MQESIRAPQAAAIQQLGRYEIIGELGRGAMGIVYKAQDPLIERLVAIKSVGMGMSQEEAETFERRFYREAKSAGRLSHPNIVTIHDVGKSGDHAYIAMEFLEGQSLREILDSGVVLPLEIIADICAQVADGLAFAHQNDVVHRDIKPANIMVLHTGTVKITDFGIALLPTGSRTLAGAIFGSPKYISPEQIIGQNVDGRSDTFSLGAVLYEMLTGLSPFTGEDLNAILFQVINDMPAPPSSRNKKIPQAFDYIVAKAMAKHPDDRYQGIQEMAADLRNHAKLTPTTTPPIAPRSLERRTQRRPEGEGRTPLQQGGESTIPITAPPVVDRRRSKRDAQTSGVASKSKNESFWYRKLLLYGAPLVLLAVFSSWALLHKRAPKPQQAPETVEATVSDTSQSAPPKSEAMEPPKPSDATPTPSPAQSPAVEKIPQNALAPTTTPAPAPQGANVTAQETVTEPLPAPPPRTPQASGRLEKAPHKTTPSAPQPKTKKGAALESKSGDAAANASTLSAAEKEKKKATFKPPGTVIFAVTPWGEIYVDGKQEGISPPLKELNLSPGKHIIEVRNTEFPPHKEAVEVTSGATVKVKHKF